MFSVSFGDNTVLYKNLSGFLLNIVRPKKRTIIPTDKISVFLFVFFIVFWVKLSSSYEQRLRVH